MSLPVLSITGTDHYTWGVQHGEAFAAEIRALADIRNELLIQSLGGWSRQRIDRLCDEQLAALERQWPDVLTELRGISDASKVSLRELVNLNAYTDLKDFADSERGGSAESGCSVFGAKGPHINAAGQTWDMHASAEPFLVLLDFPDAPIPARVLTLTGCLALCGINTAGVSVMINNLSCRQTNRQGIIWNGLVRMLLEARTARTACDVLRANLPTSGHHYLISDEREAFSIETTGLRIEQYDTASVDRHRLVVHTNHYLTPLIADEVTEKLSATTRPRFAALEAFRQSHPIETLTNAAVEHAFLERGELCDCIFLQSPTPHGAATCGGIMVDYLTRTAYAYRGRYTAAERAEWRF